MEEQTTTQMQPAESAQTELQSQSEPSANAANSSATQDSFETLDYVKELFLNSQEQLKADKKKIRLMRLCAIFMGVIMVALVAALVLAGPYLKSAISDFHSITLKIQEIDIQKLTAEAEALMNEATVSIKAVGDAASKLESLDTDSMNEAIKQLTITVENLGKMDIASLNSAIEALNTAAEKLSNFKLFG